jgi:hypothetical protein
VIQIKREYEDSHAGALLYYRKLYSEYAYKFVVYEFQRFMEWFVKSEQLADGKIFLVTGELFETLLANK